jgi:hypothetical protein
LTETGGRITIALFNATAKVISGTQIQAAILMNAIVLFIISTSLGLLLGTILPVLIRPFSFQAAFYSSTSSPAPLLQSPQLIRFEFVVDRGGFWLAEGSLQLLVGFAVDYAGDFGCDDDLG